MDVPLQQQVKVVLKVQGKPDTTGSILLKYWTVQSANRRGFFFFSLIYFFGTLSIVNPIFIMHFVVPPIWIFIGPYVGHKIAKAFGDTFELKKGHGTCPSCLSDTIIFPYGSKEDFVATCQQCGIDFHGRVIE